MVEAIPLKLTCTQHSTILLEDGRCAKCGHYVDAKPVTVAYRLAKMDQDDLEIEKGRWIAHPWAHDLPTGGFGSRSMGKAA